MHVEKIVSVEIDPTNHDPYVKVHDESISRVLSHHQGVDNIMVVALMGATRLGKSFLMNVFAVYLQHLSATNGKYDDSTWLRSHTRLDGVDWGRQRKPLTEGIWIWNQPILLTFDNVKVRVILVDCQGTEDTESGSPTLNALITTLGLKLSTVHILNIRETLSSNDITILKNCIDNITGREIRTFNNLWVVHRDWQHDDQHGLRQHVPNLQGYPEIRQAFHGCCAYMLPDPGNGICTASRKSNYTLFDLYKSGPNERVFMDKVAKLCDSLFCDQDSRSWIRTYDFVARVKSICTEFGSGQSIAHLVTQAEGLKHNYLITAVDKIEAEYRKKITDLNSKDFGSSEHLVSILENIRSDACRELDRLVKEELGDMIHERSFAEYIRTQKKRMKSSLTSSAQFKVAMYDLSVTMDVRDAAYRLGICATEVIKRTFAYVKDGCTNAVVKPLKTLANYVFAMLLVVVAAYIVALGSGLSSLHVTLLGIGVMVIVCLVGYRYLVTRSQS